MKKLKDFLSFTLSMIVIAVSVVILVLISLISLAFNSLLFILMVAGLCIPMLGNMLMSKLPQNKQLL
jgi:hypothetical protein